MRKIFLGLFACLLTASVVQAGSMTTTLAVAGKFDAGFNPLPFNGVPGGPITAADGAGIYQIDVLFTATNEGSNKGWANTLFNVGLTGVTNGGGWAAVTDTFDSNGAAPGGVVPIYATNGDLGADTADLQNIIVSISGAGLAATDGRNKLGTSGAPAAVGFPTKLGSIFVDWNGTSSGAAVVKDQTFSFTNTDGSFAPVQQGAGASITFQGGLVSNPILTSNPVPGAGIELNFGLLPTGQNPAPLPIALSNTGTGNPITVSSITLAGPNAANFVLTGTLPTSLAAGAAAQQFGVDWGTPGQPAGIYNAQVLVNTSAGNLVFDVQAQIPEPATLALAGLAMVGFVGFARRS